MRVCRLLNAHQQSTCRTRIRTSVNLPCTTCTHPSLLPCTAGCSKSKVRRSGVWSVEWQKLNIRTLATVTRCLDKTIFVSPGVKLSFPRKQLFYERFKFHNTQSQHCAPKTKERPNASYTKSYQYLYSIFKNLFTTKEYYWNGCSE